MPIEKLRPSFTFTEDRLKELAAVVPEVFADGKINWDVLREALGEYLEEEDQEHFGLTWPGKREARRLAALLPKGTMIPQPDEGVNEETTRNIFIEGENLEVLKLLQKSYAGRVKMIYIDPPYNTGNDFVYHDDYSEPLEAYLQRTGQMNEAGQVLSTNTRASGRFHSNWLNMMYPRLLLAKSLLSEDGAIFVSIDDNEFHNLRSIMNEIFGEENFILCLVWKRRQVPDNRNINNISIDHEYVVIYGAGNSIFRGKPKDLSKYKNPDNDPRGPWMSDNLTGLANSKERPNLHYEITDPETGLRYPPHPSRGWIYERKKMKQMISEGRIIFPSKPDGRPRLKRYIDDIRSHFTGFSSLQDVGYTTDGTRELFHLFGEKVFPFPKPKNLLRILVKQISNSKDEDIVLDFFAGTCTTAESVLELNREDNGNRRFIMVQLPEPIENENYSTISDIGRERIRRAIVNMKEDVDGKLELHPEEDLGVKCYRLDRSSYKDWQPYEGEETAQLESLFDRFETPLVEGWLKENLLTEILLLQGFPLDSRIVPLEAIQGNTVQRVHAEAVAHELFVCLDEQVSDETIQHLHLRSEDIFVCLDSALSDEAKIRLSDQCNLKVI